MTIETAAADHVRQLRHVGIRPHESLVRTIVKDGDLAIPALLALATDIELLDADRPECYAPIHALRLLGEIPRVAMIEPLLAPFPVAIDPEVDELRRGWASEVPQIIGRLGEAAFEPLWAIYNDQEATNEARGLAIVSLCCATAIVPEKRDELIEQFHQKLEQAETTFDRTVLVLALARLGISADYSSIMKLYRENKLDTEILPASNARQLLLSGGDRSLNCTAHTLAERYDQHGPVERPA